MKRKLTIATLLIGVVAAASAVPAWPGARIVKQADGTEITIYQHGDEYFHYTTDAEGNWIELKDGMYQQIPALSEAEQQERRKLSPILCTTAQTRKATPLNIAPRGLMILVNFSNKEFQTDIAEIDSMINGQNYTRNYSYTYSGYSFDITSKGSARQYFRDASYGKYNPVFDVVGPVTLPKTDRYYGGNNMANASEMILNACEIADTLGNGVDFTQYDNDGDGVIDFVYILYAGYGSADGGPSYTVWPHSSDLSGYFNSYPLDGKVLGKYACSNEIKFSSKLHNGIGTFCHEFGHVLGLPDFYNTGKGSHKTLGEWDIMDAGPYNNDGNTPPTYSGYERFFMGWAEPEILTDDVNKYYLYDLKDSNQVVLLSETNAHNLVGNNPSPNSFYILENRMRSGWDQYLPSAGLLITKVNYSYSKWHNNTVNNDANDMGVDLIEADRKTNQTEGKAGDAFPNGAEEYTLIPGHSITSIVRTTKGVIRFKHTVNKSDVENIETSDKKARAIMRNGEIIIVHDGKEYDLLGHELK